MSARKMKKEKRAMHYEGGACYYLHLKTKLLPFVVDKKKFKEIEEATAVMQKFVSYVEKKFDTIWYMGSDYFDDDLYERFMFHHGGFMEISLKGEIRCFLYENKLKKLKDALHYAALKVGNKGSAMHTKKQCKVGKKLISLEKSI